MFESWSEVLKFIAPAIAAQFYIIFFAHLLSCWRKSSVFCNSLVLFVIGFSLFLLTKLFVSDSSFSPLFCAQVALLNVFVIPSLLIASIHQFAQKHRKWLSVLIYSAGILVAAGTVFFAFPFSEKVVFSGLGIEITEPLANPDFALKIQAGAVFGLIILPSIFMLIRELLDKFRVEVVDFLLGSIWFGLFVTASLLAPNYACISYVLSVFSIIFWIGSIMQDRRAQRDCVSVLTEDLQRRVKSGVLDSGAYIEKMLIDLEEVSGENINVYKLRLRETLNRLTESAIQAGCDFESLFLRNKLRIREIQNCIDRHKLRDMVVIEVQMLSRMIAEVPIRQSNVYVTETRRFITMNFAHDFSIDEISTLLKISRARLSREFKRATGLSIKQFTNIFRMEKACELLGEYSSSEVASLVGISDIRQFVLLFKKHTGLTPNQFQNSAPEF